MTPFEQLGRSMRRMLTEHPLFQANPLGDWEDLVGEQVAQYSYPKELKDGCLLIVCYDAVWKHHLEMNREALLERINQEMDIPLVRKIRFRIGELPEPDTTINSYARLLDKMKPRRRRPRKRKVRLRTLSEDEKALVSGLADKDLRRLAKRLLRRVPLDDSDGAAG